MTITEYNGVILPIKYNEFRDDTGPHRGILSTKIKPTKNGFTIHRFSHYITLEYVRIRVHKDGFLSAKTVVKKNYFADRHYTEYFDNKGNEIKGKRAWDKLRFQS